MIKLKVRILITGAAGSIGAPTLNLLKKKNEVLGIDNFSSYYSVEYKRERVEYFKLESDVHDLDICDFDKLSRIFLEFKPEVVVHLAARPGVRAPNINLGEYIDSNIVGFNNMTKLSYNLGISKFIFASSSSVYSSKNLIPFSEFDTLYYPKSFYALTKQSNEMIAKSFASESTKFLGMRFFTVYGPWGRPDMAIQQFLGKAIKGVQSKFTSNLMTKRDFTYIDDVTKVIGESIELKFTNNFQVINVGASSPRTMKDLFQIMTNLGMDSYFEKYPPSDSDLNFTHASIDNLRKMGFTVPTTTLEMGVLKTYEWLNSQESQTALNAILQFKN